MNEAMVKAREEVNKILSIYPHGIGRGGESLERLVCCIASMTRAAYVDGLKYAAIIARERGKPHDIDWWHNSSKREISRQTAIDLAELIEQHAKEMGHE